MQFFTLLFYFIIDVPADVPDRYPRFFGEFFRLLDDLLPALFRQRGYGQPDDLPVVRRRQAEI